MSTDRRYRGDESEVVRRLIADNPWGTIVSHHDGRLVASHHPVLLDEDGDRRRVVS